MKERIINLYDKTNEANALLDFVIDKSKNSKSLSWQKKSKGQFYTHEFIAEKLIRDMIKRLENMEHKNNISVIDPFCGDGRLIQIFLKEISMLDEFKETKFYLHCWDIDEDSVTVAVENITEVASKYELDVLVEGRVCDSFTYAGDYANQFDICLTNPPWLIVKPSKRETELLSHEEYLEYIQVLRDLDDLLSRYYPLSMPSKKFAGWGTNLARCGTELSLMLIKNNGTCGLVSPASLIGDQVSANLRKWIFEEFSVKTIAYYVAEAKLFGKVDQDAITMILTKEDDKKTCPILTYYNKDLSPTIYNMSEIQWEQIKKENYVIPIQFGFQIIEMNELFSALSSMRDLELDNLIWMGREIDETKIDTKLSNLGKYPFIKGKMVDRYKFNIEINRYLDDRKFDKLPNSIKFERIIWRDVSRMSQKRRMIATIIPPSYVTGNSLHVLYSIAENSNLLRALLAIMNSLIFEAQVRASSATNHVSLGIVRSTKVPTIGEDQMEKLSQMVENSIENQIQLEVYIAYLYGLSYEQFLSILTMFDKLTISEKEALEQEAFKVLRSVNINDTKSCIVKS
ncbi:Alw26I/Eco31I/Esp3I family type II restriction adenine-specific DNA-methyltransferase [Bacillus paranthracis]|uniref:Alw26I/Eco31I/Esp3I family type II restriction adenine-specific DNA-methyltransferase n=1 Tax=Bacillus paranthracis TaxID=2026186 RepID=UPI0021586C35|nr:Alw26I/Eco31I/Esp3I family type II restriction adenine-specific DNA-methyltransferase [Bacillus paranthracis]MCR6790480.1 Alw26I/Eco31I/Esp3I family type II restriction adenine-specific DNA-methyltransferase [Bacillus paranthracis]MED1164909.1 Alw26I/Eco31I/Esp3I family type II restriction adenine-specific DNA-methyltransferase [Bacillus paranthracis]